MLLFDLVGLMNPEVTPRNAKVHLAGWNGTEDPLRVYFQGAFEGWQAWQSLKNFERPFVVSLIQLPERDQWLYVGTYASAGQRYDDSMKRYHYNLTALPSCAELAGRLVVNFTRPGRNSYLMGDGIAERINVREIKSEPMQLQEFPGFKKVDLAFADLAVLERQRTTSWRVALSNVAGIYLVSDPDAGKLYVGSATGEGGIWTRWCQYVDGHGSNAELYKLIAELGTERARAFRFSILEIADLHASRDEILERESHWKRVLLSRSHGYNAN